MIIILGILAVIAIPVFLAQREKAWEATAQSDVRNAAAAATSCSSDAGGTFDGSGGGAGAPVCNVLANLAPYGFHKTQAVTSNGMSGNACNWAFTAQHSSDGRAAQFTTWDSDADAAIDNAGQVRMVARGTVNPAAAACPP